MRFASIHESDGASDQRIETAVYAASSATAASVTPPCSRWARARGTSSAAAHSTGAEEHERDLDVGRPLEPQAAVGERTRANASTSATAAGERGAARRRLPRVRARTAGRAPVRARRAPQASRRARTRRRTYGTAPAIATRPSRISATSTVAGIALRAASAASPAAPGTTVVGPTWTGCVAAAGRGLSSACCSCGPLGVRSCAGPRAAAAAAERAAAGSAADAPCRRCRRARGRARRGSPSTGRCRRAGCCARRGSRTASSCRRACRRRSSRRRSSRGCPRTRSPGRRRTAAAP